MNESSKNNDLAIPSQVIEEARRIVEKSEKYARVLIRRLDTREEKKRVEMYVHKGK